MAVDPKKGRADRIRDAFAQYLSPKIVEALAEDAAPNPTVERGEIPFILLQVRDDEVEGLKQRLGRALAIVIDGDGMPDILGSIMLVTFGFPRSAWASAEHNAANERCREVAVTLQKEMGADVRAVFGAADGFVGNIGGSHYLSYGAAIPNFGALTAKLVQLEFGRVEAV